MAMAGDELSSGGGRELALSPVPRFQQQQQELPWSALLSQLQSRVTQLQGHVNQHLQARFQVSYISLSFPNAILHSSSVVMKYERVSAIRMQPYVLSKVSAWKFYLQLGFVYVRFLIVLHFSTSFTCR
jgi:hypothetical protein